MPLLRDVGTQEQITARVEQIILTCKSPEAFRALARNIASADLAFLDPYIAKCNRNANILMNDALLPDPFEGDHDRVNLRNCWLQASAIKGRIGSHTLQMVRRRGYLGSMLAQLRNVAHIGGLGFVSLQEHNCLQYSAEVLMRQHYSEKLTAEQIERIDAVLADAGYVIGEEDEQDDAAFL